VIAMTRTAIFRFKASKAAQHFCAAIARSADFDHTMRSRGDIAAMEKPPGLQGSREDLCT